ncbi:MAG: hypothetical protein WD059_05525 [Balneolaceae bacterium]
MIPYLKQTGFLLTALFIIAGCTQPKEETHWYKGNLHTHSYWSDGDNYPEMIMKWYKDHDYDFIALSDHNTLAEGEKWIEVEKGSTHELAFEKYLNTYDSTWVEFTDEGDHYKVRLKTLEEYRKLSEKENEFLIIKSEEISDGFDRKPVHVNATNIKEFIKPQGGNSIREVMQNNIDAVLEQREATGQPMFPHINHPNFYWAVTAEDLKALEGEQFFEVYNGHPAVNNYGDSLRSGTEQMWDEVNTHYLLNNKSLLFGIAVDDAHRYHDQDINKSNPGRGWINVKSNSLTADSLIHAMERGDFYASTGVSLNDISFDGRTLKIEIDAEEDITYTTQFIGTRINDTGEMGVLFNTTNGISVSHEFTGDELYIRAKIISDKIKENPYAIGETEVAWIQPVVQSVY